MQMIFMTYRSSLQGEVLKWLEAEGISFTFVEQAHGKGVTGHAPGSLYWGGTKTRCCLREFKMNSSVTSGNAFKSCNGSSMEKARWQFPFMSSSCLASNGSSVSW